MTDKTKSPSRMAGYNETMRQLVARDGLVCFLCGHKHATVHTIQADLRVVADAGGSFELDNLVVTCKPCAKRRNGKPIGAYWRERMSAAAAEMAHIEMMAANKGVMQALSATIRYAPSITGDTPDAVGVTGSTDPVPNRRRATRVHDYHTLPLEDTEASGPHANKPKDRQHGDIFIDFDKDVVVWDADFVRKDKTKGAWVRMDRAVESGTFPADWAENSAHEVYPPADYAPSITPETPDAVDVTGQEDEPEEDPAVMLAARVAPDADTEVTHVWFDGALYWRELCYTHPATGETTLTDEVFTPD